MATTRKKKKTTRGRSTSTAEPCGVEVRATLRALARARAAIKGPKAKTATLKAALKSTEEALRVVEAEFSKAGTGPPRILAR